MLQQCVCVCVCLPTTKVAITNHPVLRIYNILRRTSEKTVLFYEFLSSDFIEIVR